jgi:hypothetical protein
LWQQFISEELQERLHAVSLNGRKRYAITARRSVILLGQSVGFA